MIIELLDSRVLLAYSPIGPEVGAINFGSSIADYQGGGFITVGQESNGATLDVFIRRYEANGTFVSRTRANLDTAGTQTSPRMTALSNGNFVVAWAQTTSFDYKTEMRLLGPDLTPLSNDLDVSETWLGTAPTWAYYPRVASMPNGEFAVAWCDANLLPHVQVYHPDASLKSTQILSESARGSRILAFDADSAGNLFLLWGGGFVGTTPFAIRTNSLGTPLIAPVTIAISNTEWNLSGGMDNSGKFVVTANDAMRRYNADGTPLGVPINLGTTASVRESVVEPDGTHFLALTLVQPSYQRTELRVYSPDDTLQQRMLIDNGFNYSRRVVAVDVMADSSIRIISSRSYSGSQASYYARHYTRFDTQTRGQIGDRVWEDTNGDGIQTAGEQNMSGVTLTLFNEFGLHIADVVSSATGYLFDYVMPEQQVYVTVTRGTLVHSPRAATSDGTVDSDADPSTGRTDLFTLSSSENRTSVDFGLFRSSSIRGTAYNDRNANGVKDSGEFTVGGITLYIDKNTNGELEPNEPSAVNLFATGSGYVISNLPAGSFQLAVLPRLGWTTPAAKTITLGTGVLTTVDVPVRTHTSPGLLAPRLAASPLPGANLDTFTALATAPNEDVVVAWHAYTTSTRLFVRTYGPDGTPKSDAFDAGAADVLTRPDVVVLSDGRFVVSWEGADGKPYVRLFSPAAIPLTAPIIVTDPPTSSLGAYLTLIADSSDRVMAVWTASGSGLTTLRRFAADLTPIGSEIVINRPPEFTSLGQPAAAALPNGGVVICWVASGESAHFDVHGQWFDDQLVALGPVKLLAQSTTGLHSEVRVVADDAGTVTVMWSGPNGTGLGGVQARRYTQTGAELGPETSDFSQGTLEGLAANSRGDVVQINKDPAQFAVRITSSTGAQEGAYSLLTSNLRPGRGSSIAISERRVVWVAYPQFLSSTFNGVFLRSFVWSPRLYETRFTVDAAAPALRYIFNENVAESLTPESIAILDRSTNAPVSTAVELSYDPSLNRAEFRLPELPDGNYRATLAASAVTDDVGNPLTASNDLEFFVFSGDANRDRAVNIRDFALFAPRYGLAGTFSEGDFNYSGFVDVADFSLLAANFNEVLPAPAPLSNRAWQRPPFRSSNEAIGLRSDNELLFELAGEVDQSMKTLIGGSFQQQIYS